MQADDELQWSHGILAMDRWNFAYALLTLASVLQWSHGILAMDSALERIDADRAAWASMEPWHFSHG